MTNFLTSLIPVLPAGPGVCKTCHGPAGVYERCYACHQHVTSLGVSEVPVVPLALAVKRGQFASALYRYKNSSNATEAATLSGELVNLIDHLLPHVARCVGDPLMVSWIPSRRSQDPVEGLLKSSKWARGEFWVPLLQWRDETITSHTASSTRFVASGVANSDVLLLDDTWTTGATALSAARAAKDAGARSVSVVVLGRHFDSSWKDNHRYLEQASKYGVGSDVCAHCSRPNDVRLHRPEGLRVTSQRRSEVSQAPSSEFSRVPDPTPSPRPAPAHAPMAASPSVSGLPPRTPTRAENVGEFIGKWFFLLFLFPGPIIALAIYGLVAWIIS